MGALLNRLPLADRLFRCGVALGRTSGGAPALTTLGLGALLAPMNGSVGASVAMLARNVAPKLAARDVPAAESTALVCVASTLGVVIPPSLVLILLGDAMMRAHTQAAHATGSFARLGNTQDIFRPPPFPFPVPRFRHRPPARSPGPPAAGGRPRRRHYRAGGIRRQRLRARRFRDRLRHRADRHAGRADARARRRLDLGAGPARSA